VSDFSGLSPQRAERQFFCYSQAVASSRSGVIPADVYVAAITVPAGELDGFVRPDQIAARAGPIVARRIQACLQAPDTGAVAALDGGSPIT
jgi:hypothetical protein